MIALYNGSMNSEKETSFRNLGINKQLVDHLEKIQFKTPTPIQHKAIPVALTGQDFVGIAQTGTGKTLAFGIPMVQKVIENNAYGLVLVPTRELAQQVEETLAKISRPFKIKTALIIGGASINNQIKDLKQNPQIIIATPGRLNDHIKRHSVFLSDIRTVVLDEADRMLDMGFEPQIRTILKMTDQERQTLLFSATMPPKIVKMSTQYMQMPISIEVAKQGSTAKNITQEVFIIKKENKTPLLVKLVEQYQGTILVFTRTKFGARKLTQQLNNIGYKTAEIHSNRSLAQRRTAIEGFKSGRFRILVATDIAARGIDVSNIEVVINYDLPEDIENYVHRIGRTARAGKEGRAVSFATPDQRGTIKQIEKLIRMEIEIAQHPEIISATFSATEPHRTENRPRSYGRPARKNYSKNNQKKNWHR